MAMCDEEDDVEVALVCPAQAMGLTYPEKAKGARVDTDTKKASGKDDSFFSVQQMKKKLVDQTISCLVASVVLVIVLGGCILSFFYCKECLLGILILSACLCPWIPYFNIPLWVSIGLMIWLGFHFTQRAFTFIWD